MSDRVAHVTAADLEAAKAVCIASTKGIMSVDHTAALIAEKMEPERIEFRRTAEAMTFAIDYIRELADTRLNESRLAREAVDMLVTLMEGQG